MLVLDSELLGRVPVDHLFRNSCTPLYDPVSGQCDSDPKSSSVADCPFEAKHFSMCSMLYSISRN